MNPSLADRLLLVLVLEVSALLVVVSVADSALGAYVVPDLAAAVLIGAGLLIPVVVWMPFAARHTDRLMRSIGLAVLTLGLTATFVRSHEVAEVTILMVGIALFTYADLHRRRRPTVGEQGRPPQSTDHADPARIPSLAELGTRE